MLETHLTGKTTKKRQNFDPSTSPASTEHLYLTLNRETRRAPGHQSLYPDSLGRRGQVLFYFMHPL
jgi:hypothetical protein